MDSEPTPYRPESLPRQVRRLGRTSLLILRRRRAFSGPIGWVVAVLLADLLIDGLCDLGGGIDGFPYRVGWVLWTLILLADGAASATSDVAVVWAVLAPLAFPWRIVSSFPAVLLVYLLNDYDMPGWVLLGGFLCWLIVAVSLQPLRRWLRGSLGHRSVRPIGNQRTAFRIRHLLIVTLGIAVVFAVVRRYDLSRVANPLVDADYSQAGLLTWIVGSIAYALYVLLIVFPLVLVVLRASSLRDGVLRASLMTVALVFAGAYLSVGMGWYVAYPDSVATSVAYCLADGVGCLSAAASFAVALRRVGYRWIRD